MLWERLRSISLAGKRPVDIFRQAGVDVPMLGEKRIERATARWRAMYAANGMEALRGQVKENAKKKAAARTKKKAGADGREYVCLLEKVSA